MNQTYSTTHLRAVIALALGAIVAGPLTMLVMLAPAIAADTYDIQSLTAQFAFASVAAIVVYAVGLLVLATPCWVLLHKRGHRSWRAAAALGGALGFVVTMLLYVSPTFPIRPEGSHSSTGDGGGLLIDNNVVTTHGWITFISYSLIYALVCAAIGVLIWRIAYRRQLTDAD